MMIRSDNGPELTSKAMLGWAPRHGITLRLIEPGKPNQKAYVESCNGRLRDECPMNGRSPALLMHALSSKPGDGSKRKGDRSIHWVG